MGGPGWGGRGPDGPTDGAPVLGVGLTFPEPSARGAGCLPPPSPSSLTPCITPAGLLPPWVGGGYGASCVPAKFICGILSPRTSHVIALGEGASQWERSYSARGGGSPRISRDPKSRDKSSRRRRLGATGHMRTKAEAQGCLSKPGTHRSPETTRNSEEAWTRLSLAALGAGRACT